MIIAATLAAIGALWLVFTLAAPHALPEHVQAMVSIVWLGLCLLCGALPAVRGRVGARRRASPKRGA